MLEIVNQIVDCLDRPRPLIYCRLVETRGSTPQKAGAAMLVFADGSQAGTLGGGCVEAEVKRRALAILDSGQAEVATFQLDSDYGWDDGLICGGRMRILIQPLRALSGATDASAHYFRTYRDLLAQGTGCIEAVLFDTSKSNLPSPACYLFDSGGQPVARDLLAATAPAAVAHEIAERLPLLGSRPRPSAEQGVAFLPVLPRCRLLIVGGGHVGQAVGTLASNLDFDVWVVDDREEFVSAARFPRAARLIHGPIGPTLRDLPITPQTYAIIVTRGHNHDEEALFHLAERGARYVGLIGSRRKIKLIFDDLESQGISSEALSRVHAPLGIDIGSQTVAEIAISILAELVAHRNLNGEVPGRPAPIMAAPP